jgi:hypothetical protein
VDVSPCARLIENTTSSALKALPSCHFTPAQVEAPHRGRDLRPALGQARDDLHLLALAHQRLVDLAVDRVVDDLVLAVRVGARVVREARQRSVFAAAGAAAKTRNSRRKRSGA